jgi:hypothetical protein
VRSKPIQKCHRHIHILKFFPGDAPLPGTPVFFMRLSVPTTSGNSIASTVRMTGIAKTTILRLIKSLGEACQKFRGRQHNPPELQLPLPVHPNVRLCIQV